MLVQIIEQPAGEAPEQEKTRHQQEDAQIARPLGGPEQALMLAAFIAHDTSQSQGYSKRLGILIQHHSIMPSALSIAMDWRYGKGIGLWGKRSYEPACGPHLGPWQ
jgi:hypothetical protein